MHYVHFFLPSSTSYSLAPFSWLTFSLSLFHFLQPNFVLSRFLTFCPSSVSFAFSSSSALSSVFCCPLLPLIVSSYSLGLLFCLSLFHFLQPIIVLSRFLTFCLSSVSFAFSSSSALSSVFCCPLFPLIVSPHSLGLRFASLQFFLAFSSLL